MSDKELSGEEKRRRMKEQFKKTLREKKEFQEKVNKLRRLQNINTALDGMKMEDDSQDWIDRLDQETAFNEAKTEMALENAEQAAKDRADEAEIKAAVAMSEAEMQKLAAEEMVRKMKEEMAREAELGVTGGDAGDTQSRGLLNVEVSSEGKVEAKEADPVDSDRPARKMIPNLGDAVSEIKAVVENEAPATEAEAASKDSEGQTEE